MAEGLDLDQARALIRAALEEDVGSGDITSALVVPAQATFRGVMQARESMVVAGLPVAQEVFRMVVPQAR